MKIRLQHPGGWFVDRVPAWIRWATVEPNKMGAKYDGIFWDPPAPARHAWCLPCTTKHTACTCSVSGMQSVHPCMLFDQLYEGRV